MAKKQGKVKWFNLSKGYGFIEAMDSGRDVFVHISAVQKAGVEELKPGMDVEFETFSGKDGRISAISLDIL